MESWPHGSVNTQLHHDSGKELLDIRSSPIDFERKPQRLDSDPVSSTYSEDEIFIDRERSRAHSPQTIFDSSYRHDHQMNYVASAPSSLGSDDNTTVNSMKTHLKPAYIHDFQPRGPVPMVLTRVDGPTVQQKLKYRPATKHTSASKFHPYFSTSSVPDIPNAPRSISDGRPASPPVDFVSKQTISQASHTMIQFAPSPLPLTRTRPGPGPGPGPGLKIAAPPSALAPRNVSVPPNRGVSLSRGQEWQNIKRLRATTWSLRARVQEMRKELRQKQLAKSTADDKLLLHVRAEMSRRTTNSRMVPVLNASSSTLLEELVENSQRARDDYGPFEDDCNNLEDQLGREEYKLTKAEASFNDYQIELQATANAEDTSSEPPSPVASTFSDSDVGEDCHPLVSKYLSKMGDVDIFRERLGYHIEERYSLLDEKESRELVGLKLLEEDQAILDDFESAQEKLLRQIADAERDAEKLKKECITEGLLDEQGNPTSLEFQEQLCFLNEEGIDAKNESSDFVKHPALLLRSISSNPNLSSLDFRQSELSLVEDKEAKATRINFWLLDILLSSPLEVNLLSRTSRDVLEVPDVDDEWDHIVIKCWFTDATRFETSQYRKASTGVVTHGDIYALESMESFGHHDKLEQTARVIQASFGGSHSRASSDAYEILP